MASYSYLIGDTKKEKHSLTILHLLLECSQSLMFGFVDQRLYQLSLVHNLLSSSRCHFLFLKETQASRITTSILFSIINFQSETNANHICTTLMIVLVVLIWSLQTF